MRVDWRVVAEDKRKRNEWSEADEKEVGDIVKKVVAGTDEEALLRWARWLAELASAVLLFDLVGNGINGHIRAAMADEKLKKAGK
jgi:hypothetical protein